MRQVVRLGKGTATSENKDTKVFSLGGSAILRHDEPTRSMSTSMSFAPQPRIHSSGWVTSGMSDLPMSMPQEIDAPRFAELIVTLPPDWKLDQEPLNDESWYWPVRLIKSMARFPHK